MKIVLWIILYLVVVASVLAEEKGSSTTVVNRPADGTLTSSNVLTYQTEEQHVFNHTISSFLENLYDGVSEEVMKGAFTYDKDGHPMIKVNEAQVLLLAALLTEHDERYHEDWPGHVTIIPEENLIDEDSENSGGTEESIKSSDENVAKDGHILAGSIDDALTGHVHPKDEADLQQIMDEPPKRVRVRRAFFNKGKRGRGRKWPDGTIPYVFDQKISDNAKSFAIRAMNHIMNRVPCVKFQPAQRGTNNYVLITSSADNCFAQNIGFRLGQTIMNLGQGCGYAVTVHEWGHVLGAIHTQARPDRDDYIEINWPNIEPSMVPQFYKKNWSIDKDDLEYDYASMMHYPTHAFSINPRIHVLRVKPPNQFDLLRVGHSEGLSTLDEKSFRNWYGCPAEIDKAKEKNMDMKKDKEDIIDEISQSGSVDCVVSPWSRWTICGNGKRARLRQITQDAKKGGSCPQIQKLVSIRKCRTRTTRAVSMNFNEFETDDGNVAEVYMTKVVAVTAGQPIILVISNPKNLPVKWYRVVNGDNVEIEKDDNRYHIERTHAGNDRLVTGDSGMKDDGHLFVAKIAMSHSVLSVAWSITVDSVEEAQEIAGGQL